MSLMADGLTASAQSRVRRESPERVQPSLVGAWGFAQNPSGGRVGTRAFHFTRDLRLEFFMPKGTNQACTTLSAESRGGGTPFGRDLGGTPRKTPLGGRVRKER